MSINNSNPIFVFIGNSTSFTVLSKAKRVAKIVFLGGMILKGFVVVVAFAVFKFWEEVKFTLVEELRDKEAVAFTGVGIEGKDLMSSKLGYCCSRTVFP